MDANHQDTANNNLATTEDVEWVLSKKSKLLIPQHKNQEKKRFKVPFDWLNLIGVFLIPFVVTVIGLYATQQITQQQAQASERQHQTDLQIAQDQQQATTLKAYQDDMTSLLLNNNLRNSHQGDEVRIVARIKTLTTIRQLNGTRKGLVLQFLHEAGLIQNLSDPPIVLLQGADLSGADLRGTDLSGDNLRRVNLRGADLRGTDLNSDNLSGADLSKDDLNSVNLSASDLNEANLVGADLSHADLTSALNLTQQQLDQVTTCKGAKLPKGLTCHHNNYPLG